MKYPPRVYRNIRLCVPIQRERGMRQRAYLPLRYKLRVYGIFEEWSSYHVYSDEHR